MARIIIIFGTIFAVLGFALNVLQFKLLAQNIKTEIIIAIVGIIFAALGIWFGLSFRKKQSEPFIKNEKAIETIGLSGREFEVLEELALGAPNKMIARKLKISPNTVKTHISRIIEKLEASNRTEAINKARELSILP